jgi:hypothetical protein
MPARDPTLSHRGQRQQSGPYLSARSWRGGIPGSPVDSPRVECVTRCDLPFKRVDFALHRIKALDVGNLTNGCGFTCLE